MKNSPRFRSRTLERAWVVCGLLFGLGLASQVSAQGVATDAQPAADRARVAAIVRDLLLNDPTLLRDAIDALQARESAARDAQRTEALQAFTAEIAGETDAPVGGNPQGDVTVVEFYDYLCGFCKRSAGEVLALKQRDPRVRVVYKEFPVLGETSLTLARAALAAHRQGRFEAFHVELMRQESPDAQAARDLAARLGLDLARFDRDRADPALDAQILRNQRQAAALDISGTPAFIIGQTLIPGATDVDSLAQAVVAARASAAAALPGAVK